ncbi:MAG: hypothetical protein GY818_12020, partial [Planctomycetaceae bacterium]|nr:hypothetical protein [Planctomycetaceae bacterium]
MSSRMVVWSAVFGFILWGSMLAAEDWPGFLGSRRDGKSNEIGIVKDWSGGQLEMVWDLELGEGYGIGSAVGNRFFQLDRVGDEGRLRCVDTVNGNP